MAMDTQLKRMSAMNLSQPWRGPSVHPADAGAQAKRQAADLMYSGILAASLTPSTFVPRLTLLGVG